MTEKCRYMEAAYPDLDAEDTCTEHRHDAPTFALARAFAIAFQETGEPTAEQVAWFLDDAGAVIGDFDPAPLSWTVTQTELTREVGLEATFTINGVDYVIQEKQLRRTCRLPPAEPYHVGRVGRGSRGRRMTTTTKPTEYEETQP